MAKARLLGLVGTRGTRLLIVDYISKNGNKVKKEDLIDYIRGVQNLGRKSVLYHLREMLKTKELIEEGEYLKLVDPPSPLESWRIIGIPFGVSFIIISYIEQNPIFMTASLLFTIYAFAICFEELVFYYQRFKKIIT